MTLMFNLELNTLVAAITLSQLIVFLLFLVLSQYKYSVSNQILAFIFFILITAKIDQIFQMQGGLQLYPQVSFVLVPMQLLIAPSLYFFVLSKVSSDFGFSIKYLIHFIPAGLLYIYYGYLLIGLGSEEIRAMMATGVLTGVTDTLIIPAIGDVIQICYIFAALKSLKSQGVAFRNWFSGTENEIIKGLKALFLIWAFIFLTHLAVIVLSAMTEIVMFRRIMFEIMNILHLLLVNALMLFGIVSHLKWPASYNRSVMAVKYATSSLSQDERETLFKAAQTFMINHNYYENSDITLGQLADQIAATPRELSEAINGIGEQSFFEFVNSYRITAAAAKLKADDSLNILEIAMAVGFNSKSSFNTFFKKQMGLTPSQYRKAKL